MSITYIQKRAQERELDEIDADEPLEIMLTARDIKLAIPKNSKECALARAIKRAYPVKAAYFLRTTAWLEYEDRMVRYRLSPSVQKEIVSFDRSTLMSTGQYVLSPISPILRGKGRAKKRRKVTVKKIVARREASLNQKSHVLHDVRTKFEPQALSSGEKS